MHCTLTLSLQPLFKSFVKLSFLNMTFSQNKKINLCSRYEVDVLVSIF